jgi:DNA-binding transcriptional ArsR family regulator
MPDKNLGTRHELLDALDSLINYEQKPPVEDGWMTVADVAKEMGLEYAHAGRLLRKLVDGGKAEVMRARDGNWVRNFYRMIASDD